MGWADRHGAALTVGELDSPRRSFARLVDYQRYEYSWTTTGTIGYNDIVDIQMAYPGLAFDNTAVSGIGRDFAVFVVPAQAGTGFPGYGRRAWIPACAGMTVFHP
jgi:hypothetical protein